MKLLLPFKVGDTVRANYDTGPYRIVEILADCTCANYVDLINNGMSHAKKRRPHLHFTLVDADRPETKSGTYRESDLRWLNGFVYEKGECIDIDGPNVKGTTGWHKEDDGLDKIILVRLAPTKISKLTKPTKNGVRP